MRRTFNISSTSLFIPIQWEYHDVVGLNNGAWTVRIFEWFGESNKINQKLKEFSWLTLDFRPREKVVIKDESKGQTLYFTWFVGSNASCTDHSFLNHRTEINKWGKLKEEGEEEAEDDDENCPFAFSHFHCAIIFQLFHISILSFLSCSFVGKVWSMWQCLGLNRVTIPLVKIFIYIFSN